MQHQRTFSSAVYEIDGEWTFYPEVLGSGAELDAAKPGERDESIPYGSYRLKIHAQPKQYLTLGGYSFDYSTRVLVNGSEVLEIGKVGASAAESEPRIDYMLIPIYTGEDGDGRGGLSVREFRAPRRRRSDADASVHCGEHRPHAPKPEFVFPGAWRFAVPVRHVFSAVCGLSGRDQVCFPRGYLRAARPARPEFLCAASAACKLQLGGSHIGFWC